MTQTERNSWSGVPGDQRCECIDVNDGHPHKVDKDNQCRNVASMTLFRIDMVDLTGTTFCEDCGCDALESGLFTDIRTCACGSYDDGDCETCNAVA